MTDPVLPKLIKISVTSGAKGQPISVINRTNGDIIHETLGDTAKAIVDLQNFTNGYTDGDIIDIMVTGERMGTGSLTTSGDTPQSVTISTSAITSGVARGI